MKQVALFVSVAILGNTRAAEDGNQFCGKSTKRVIVQIYTANSLLCFFFFIPTICFLINLLFIPSFYSSLEGSGTAWNEKEGVCVVAVKERRARASPQIRTVSV